MGRLGDGKNRRNRRKLGDSRAPTPRELEPPAPGPAAGGMVLMWINTMEIWGLPWGFSGWDQLLTSRKTIIFFYGFLKWGIPKRSPDDALFPWENPVKMDDEMG